MVWLKHVWIPVALLLISFGLQMAGKVGQELFCYQRDAILDGEYWRLVTGHLVHGTWRHWLLNAAGLSLVWAIYPRYFCHISAALLCLGIALMTSASLLVWDPAVDWYLGMSAVLHGVFVAWVIVDLMNGRRIALIPLLLVVVKLVYEQRIGPLPGSVESTGLPVLVDAHLYGAIAGGLHAMVLSVFKWLPDDMGEKKRRSL